MNEREREGGHAFPTESVTQFYPGMSLRDYFAAKALAALILADGIQYASNRKSQAADARFAYEFADAMLAQRALQSKQEPSP